MNTDEHNQMIDDICKQQGWTQLTIDQADQLLKYWEDERVQDKAKRYHAELINWLERATNDNVQLVFEGQPIKPYEITCNQPADVEVRDATQQPLHTNTPT